MAFAFLAIVVSNSALSTAYFDALHIQIGPLSLQHWINDALMSGFFLMVGLEIKREMLDGQLSTWSRRLLPGAAALGGMLVPALIYVAFNRGDAAALRGWAIPTATDIAFALGVLSLLGRRVPASLKIFLAALAIIDDLGAVIIIALFYTVDLSLLHLAGAVGIVATLAIMNRLGCLKVWAYLLMGVLLWWLVWRSGVHATLAGVILALTIPLKLTPAKPEAISAESPLHAVEQLLHKPVAFVILPMFGFANAGVSFAGVSVATLIEPLTLGVAVGLFLGKLVGVFGTVALLVQCQLVQLPAKSTWTQMLGVATLCGIGFTMSLFVGLLAFDDPILQDAIKFGILAGSMLAGLSGYAILATSMSGGTKITEQR